MLESKIKILFLATGWGDHGDRERLAEEAREIVRKIRLGSHRDRFDFASEWAVKISDLQEALLRHNPSIVHFSGRSKPGGLIFLDNKGEAKQVPKNALSSLFRILKDNVGVVLLNAGYTREQARALSEVVDYAISIDDQISDAAAIVFAAHFYQSLVYGRTVSAAFDLAVNQLQLEAMEGAEAPKLLVGRGVDQAAPFLDQQVLLPPANSDAFEGPAAKADQQIKTRLQDIRLKSVAAIGLTVLALAVLLASLGRYVNYARVGADQRKDAPLSEQKPRAGTDTASSDSSTSSELRKTDTTNSNSSRRAEPQEKIAPGFPPALEKVFHLNSRADTGLTVEQRDWVKISASGRIRLGFFAGLGDPDGVPGFQDYSKIVDFPHGALLARIANDEDGGWRLVGSKASFQASHSGLLELLVNDKDPGNNQGEFLVTVSIFHVR